VDAHGVSATPSTEVSAATATATVSTTAAMLCEGSRTRAQSQHGQAGQQERGTKRSRSFHDITQFGRLFQYLL
jgi:hypothetical protein